MVAAVKSPALDPGRVRRDFPILQRHINGRELVYLDSAATSQKPVQVIEAIADYYREHNANVHRGVHTLGGEATDLYERARATVAGFIGAQAEEIVFVRNTTEAINLVASSYARQVLQPGDRVVLTELEHHSNLVPWQLAAQAAGLEIAAIPVTAEGRLDMEAAERLLAPPTKLLSVSHQSNVLGTAVPVARLTEMAHRQGAFVCVDAAQSVPHHRVSVGELGCDFLAFSGHKMCGPMGIGVLWARPELLELMPPFLGGGSMIHRVTLESSTWNKVPHKFEAGTPDVAGAVGLMAACEYLSAVGMEAIAEHERRLTGLLLETLRNFPEIEIYGPETLDERGGAVSFNFGDAHAHDVGTILDRHGVQVRAGHHCCQPLMERLGVAATTRASVYLYNTADDVARFGEALQDVRRIFR